MTNRTKKTDNSYLSISDVSGLTTALQNVEVGDVNISDVINLQTALDDKQNKITDNSYLSISDVSGLSDALSSSGGGGTTIDKDTDITTGTISSLDITLRSGTIQATQFMLQAI
jgi:hypothetical protein